MSQSNDFSQMDPQEPPINLRDYDPTVVRLSGFVIVRMLDTHQDLGDGLFTALQRTAAVVEYNLEGLLAVLEEYDVKPRQTHREIRAVPYERIRTLEANAMDSEYPPRHSLTTYYRIDLRDRPEDIEQLAERLSEFSEIVERAYADIAPANPMGSPAPGLSALAQKQQFLGRGPRGINAFSAWAKLGGSAGAGQNVRVADLEASWDFNHKEFENAAINNTLMAGEASIEQSCIDHGTAVLAILASTDPGVGTRGIVPGVMEVRVASRFQNDSDSYITEAITAVADGILSGGPALTPGDILLIETEQSGGVPVDSCEDEFDAIRLARKNLIVIEAGGNGNLDLDHFANRPAWLETGETWDSGALLVGACMAPDLVAPADRNRRWESSSSLASNYGERVHCYAWGNSVATAWGPGSDDYTEIFGGTSAASAIIAGAAALVQSLRHHVNKAPLTQDQMIQALSGRDPIINVGTPSTGDPIGVMPDLELVWQNAVMNWP